MINKDMGENFSQQKLMKLEKLVKPVIARKARLNYLISFADT